MAAHNRLAPEQLAALAPGDAVTIETSGDLRRPRCSIGTVARVVGSCTVVSSRSARGVSYVHQFDRRTGVRIGGGGLAQLVAVEANENTGDEQRRQWAGVEAAHREWARHRADVDELGGLRLAISEALKEGLVERHLLSTSVRGDSP